MTENHVELVRTIFRFLTYLIVLGVVVKFSIPVDIFQNIIVWSICYGMGWMIKELA